MRLINILGINYKVIEVEVVNKLEPRRGELDYQNCTIRIDRTMPKEMKEQTLMHEIMHAVFDLLGYDEMADNETMVQSLATALHQVFTSQTIFS